MVDKDLVVPTPAESADPIKSGFAVEVYNKGEESIIARNQQSGTRTRFSHPVVECSIKRNKK